MEVPLAVHAASEPAPLANPAGMTHAPTGQMSGSSSVMDTVVTARAPSVAPAAPESVTLKVFAGSASAFCTIVTTIDFSVNSPEPQLSVPLAAV